jgi:multiple sugar transport system substrate-binding protein
VLLSAIAVLVALAAVTFFVMSTLGGRTAAPESEEIVISFWNGFTGPGSRDIQKIVNDFNEANKGRIRVNMSVMLWGDYYVKLPLSLKGRMPPDCGVLHVPQTAEFARAGMLVPIDDYITDLDPGDFFANAWEVGEVDGRRYSIPLDMVPLVLLWNKKLYREVGLDPERPPTNRQEFIEYATRLTRDTNGDGRIDTWGTMIPVAWPSHMTHGSVLFSNGGKHVTDDEQECLAGGTESVDAIQFLSDLIFKHKVSPPNVEVNANAEGFMNGKSAMEINGIWMLPQYESARGLEFGCVILPNLGSVSKQVVTGSHNLVVFSTRRTSDERTRACVEFYKYLSNHSAAWAATGAIPVRKSFFTSGQISHLPNIMSVYRDIDAAVFPTRSLFVDEALHPVNEAITRVLSGKGEPAADLRTAAAETTRLLRQDRD